jgi:hypothetical protein
LAATRIGTIRLARGQIVNVDARVPVMQAFFVTGR